MPPNFAAAQRDLGSEMRPAPAWVKDDDRLGVAEDETVQLSAARLQSDRGLQQKLPYRVW